VALILDPASLPEEVLRELHRSLAADLAETLEMVEQPTRAVRDPSSLTTAADLVRSATAVISRPGPRTRVELAAEANLAYAAMLAAIDLVKSHTEGPTVPRARASPAP
jgi:hypothetical protein